MDITRDPIFKSIMFAMAVMYVALATQSVWAAPDKPPPEPSGEYEFVGYSTDPVTTFAINAQTLACRSSFGAEAKWATSKEVFEGYNIGTFSTFPPAGTRGVAIPTFILAITLVKAAIG
jgi:hypothetical protein